MATKEELTNKANFCLRRASDLINIGNHFAAQAADLDNRQPVLDAWMDIEIDWRLQQADTARRAARKFKKQGDKLMKKANKIREI